MPRPSARAIQPEQKPTPSKLFETLTSGWVDLDTRRVFPIGFFTVELTRPHPVDGDRTMRLRCCDKTLYTQILGPMPQGQAQLAALLETAAWIRSTFWDILKVGG